MNVYQSIILYVHYHLDLELTVNVNTISQRMVSFHHFIFNVGRRQLRVLIIMASLTKNWAIICNLFEWRQIYAKTCAFSTMIFKSRSQNSSTPVRPSVSLSVSWSFILRFLCKGTSFSTFCCTHI